MSAATVLRGIGRSLQEAQTESIEIGTLIVAIFCVVGIFIVIPLFWWKCIYSRGLLPTGLQGHSNGRRTSEAPNTNVTGRSEKEIRQSLEVLHVAISNHITFHGTTDNGRQHNNSTSESSDEELGTNGMPETRTDSPEMCQICLEHFHRGHDVAHSVVSGCSHTFHRECIVRWLQSHDDCPICRAKCLSTQ